MKARLHVLTGCTAVGKTAHALDRAEAIDAEIVSCDSLLFYRGMDIGTAKPSPQELARIRHHLIDIIDVTDSMDVTRYVEMARRAVDDILQRGKKVMVVGGSGFYLKSFFAAVADDVGVSPAIRAEVQQLDPLVALERLRTLNPAGLEALDLANPRRVARALERCLASGKTVAELAARFAAQESPFASYEVELTELVREPADLERRITTRVSTMLTAGLVDEVSGLLKRGLRENPSASRAIGYREVIDMIDGRLAPERLAEEIAANTRALVKKQRTWFRTQLPEHNRIAVDRASG